MIERSHLRIISALARHGTLTRAAEELFLTQSALSHMMHKLENLLGCTLWRREGRTLHLTDAGAALLRTAEQVLPVLENTEQLLSQIGRGKRGTLRIGIECHPCYQWLLHAIEHYLDGWPDVDIDVTERFQFSGLQALLHREVDLLVTPDPVKHAGLAFDRVLEYELFLLTSASHRLAEKSEVRPEDLADETLLTYPVARERLDVFTRFLSPERIEPREHRHIETTEVMLQFVAASRGVTTLPDYIVEKYCADLPVRAMRLGKDGMHNALYLVYRNEDRERDYLQGFAADVRTPVGDSEEFFKVDVKRNAPPAVSR